MTLQQKREIVLQFKAGRSMKMVAVYIGNNVSLASLFEIEQVIREYMNGKFQLKTRKEKS